MLDQTAATTNDIQSHQIRIVFIAAKRSKNISLTMGEISQATSYFQKAMEIYETVFEFEPDMIEAKKQELLGTYAQAGLYLGEKLLTKEGDI